MTTNKDIAEEFAEGKTKGKSDHVFIDGDTIYSYGYHFPIAKKVGNKEVDFNESKYSSTTSHHQSLVRRALESHGFKINKKKLSKVMG